MNILAWNCRGMGNSPTITALAKLIATHNPDIIFLIETKQKKNRLEKKRKNLGFGKGFYENPVGLSGGLALWWKFDVKLDVIKSEKFFIDSRIESDNGASWYCTFVYGSPHYEGRNEVWEKISGLHTIAPAPWCCLGDFNEVRDQSEKVGGLLIDNNRVSTFNDFIHDNGFLEMPVQGGNFTWTNNRTGADFIKEKLDRVLFNLDWSDIFSLSSAIADPAIESDHKPIILRLEGARKRRKKEFKFETKWLVDEECETLIKNAWAKEGIVGIQEKLKEANSSLNSWSMEKFNKAKRATDSIIGRIDILQEKARSDVENEELLALRKELETLWKMEELHWFQRAKENWIQFGDKNTHFFHASTLYKRRRNRILRLLNDQGEWIESDKGLEEHITQFFKNLFKADTNLDFSEAIEAGSPVIDSSMNEKLDLPVSMEEVKAAAFGMGSYKAPGPDGFPGIFYHKFWNVISSDLYDLVSNFFNHGLLPEELNHTNVVLIPKTTAPETIGEFRPISLCNFAYKVISRIMTTRMKPLLPSIINPAQSAFISGRQIQDNIVIAHESFNALKKRKKHVEGAYAVKLDLAKAYDKVEWPFLDALLRKMGFSEKWIDRIMTCVSTSTLSILINGKRSMPFRPERGLRQGDPLSPYLFIMVANVLSDLIEKTILKGKLEGYRIKRGCPITSHLLFADDCLIFAYSGNESEEVILNILNVFQKATGQRVNFDKSSIFFSSNTKEPAKLRIMQTLGMGLMDPKSKYLGLPSIWGRGKVEALQFVLDRVKAKVAGWKGKLLSQAGREILMKAVATAIPTYVMQIFRLPTTFCNDLNSVLSKFWWRGSESDNKSIHWMAWPKLTKGKNVGGMGFRDFLIFNKALLAKQAWRAIKNPDAIWVKVLKAIYSPYKDLINAEKGKKCSWIWNSLFEGLQVLKRGSRWNVNNGKKILIWHDKWIPNDASFTVSSPIPRGSRPMIVADLIDSENREWKQDVLRMFFNEEDYNAIAKIPIGAPSVDDELVWHFTKEGWYTVKSGYKLLLENNDNSQVTSSSLDPRADPVFWKHTWEINTIPRVKNFLWRAIHNALPSKENLKKRHCAHNEVCPRCDHHSESLEHIMFFCPFAEAVWRISDFGYLPEKIGFNSFAHWWEAIHSMLIKEKREDSIARAAQLCHALWTARNDFIFDGKNSDPLSVWRRSNLTDEPPSVDRNQQTEDHRRISFQRQPKWNKPPQNSIKLNCDASWSAKENLAGVAVVARDCYGRLVGTDGSLVKASSVRAAEAMAIRKGLQLAAKNGWSKIQLESDNKALGSMTFLDASKERLRLQAIEAYRSRKGWSARPGAAQLPPAVNT